jgi:hypothetical protein
MAAFGAINRLAFASVIPVTAAACGAVAARPLAAAKISGPPALFMMIAL